MCAIYSGLSAGYLTVVGFNDRALHIHQHNKGVRDREWGVPVYRLVGRGLHLYIPVYTCIYTPVGGYSRVENMQQHDNKQRVYTNIM